MTARGRSDRPGRDDMAAGADGPSVAHGWYALFVLCLIGMLSFIDRAILSILQIPIKAELGLSDSQLGLLTGLAFAFFYVVVALPVARIADRRSRKHVLAISLAIWTVMTAACGFAHSFIALLLLRIGLAVGEAGGAAPVHSLISDYFPRSKRTTAMTLWSSSLLAGIMLAFLLGGWLSQAIGWRDTFVVLGVAGFALVPIVLFTLKEPPRGRYDGVTEGQDPNERAPLRETVRTLWTLPTFRNFCLAGGFLAYASNAMLVWNAPFYSRVYGVTIGDIALMLATLKGVGGIAGVMIGGFLAQWLGRSDMRWYAYVPAIAAIVMVPFSLAQYFVDSLTLSFLFAIVPAIAGSVYLAPIITVVQSVSPANMRAFASASMALATTFIGYGLGPTAVGITSDFLTHRFGLVETSLRWAISLQLVGALLACWLFVRSARRLREDMQAQEHRA